MQVFVPNLINIKDSRLLHHQPCHLLASHSLYSVWFLSVVLNYDCSRSALLLRALNYVPPLHQQSDPLPQYLCQPRAGERPIVMVVMALNDVCLTSTTTAPVHLYLRPVCSKLLSVFIALKSVYPLS